MTATAAATAETALAADLRAAVEGEVWFDAGNRALYATDASNYRQVPVGVVRPRSTADVVAALEVCRRHGAAVLPRGGGTSIAGQACNVAVVIDTAQHLRGILELDPVAARARVQPGVILDTLRAAAAPHGLTFGPDPSTHSRCTLGGMIGNNACGVHSVAWGLTADNVETLDVVRADGLRLTVGPTPPGELERLIATGGAEGALYAGLRDLVQAHEHVLRTGFPALRRRVSGYALDQLLPENGFNVARALVGTEGTCATVVEATLRLVATPAARSMVVIGFADIVAAAEAVPQILEHRPLGLEGFDLLLLECLANVGHRRTDMLPPGGAWLLVELGGTSPDDAQQRAMALAGALQGGPGAAEARVLEDAADQRAAWRIREEGAGLASRLPGGAEAWSGWEDAAVPPARLGAYLREFRELLARHGRLGVLYGHFGEGCLHVRIDFDLRSTPGVSGFRDFMEEAADLVVAHGGSLSGEHGDGQARAELLPRMYSPELMQAFAEFKALWDPENRMNPGKLVAPRPLDADLRVLHDPARPVRPLRTMFSYPHDAGGFAGATTRCVGVGACRREGGGVMCPSYMVTREEAHSTRGRAHLLYEMARGETITDGWRSTEVRDALDLCLSCKGCKSDCPVGVDMATYKAEFLFHHYRNRLRPASHYSMGFLPLWAHLAQVAPRLLNAVTHAPGLARLVKRAGGVAAERSVPRFATQTFRRWFANRAPSPVPTRRRVLLWPDTFTNHLSPDVGRAAVAVLEAAGFEVVLPSAPLCCGLTWISTGQLGIARRVLQRTLRALGPELERGTPVVGLEPSCTAVFRSDLVELLPGDASQRLADQTVTLAELLARDAPDWSPPALHRRVLRQEHCHQHAVMGSTPDDELLAAMGTERVAAEPGCCGLAGNFGFERGHHAVSMACAERAILPAVRSLDETSLVLADGFSCRTQISEGSGRQALHLAQLLALALQQPSPDPGAPG